MSDTVVHREPVTTGGAGLGDGRSLGPGSLTWRYFGDWRLYLFIGRTGLLQNMHPGVSAVLEEHSVVFKNPWARIMGSIPDILGVIYDLPVLGAQQRLVVAGAVGHPVERGAPVEPRGRFDLRRGRPVGPGDVDARAARVVLAGIGSPAEPSYSTFGGGGGAG
jgi:hypothetical protein